MSYQCPVCGYPGLEDPPHTAEGGASDEICPSCGFQFGYDDDACGISYEQWREEWIAAGTPWSGIGIRPPLNWNPSEQLQVILGKTLEAREKENSSFDRTTWLRDAISSAKTANQQTFGTDGAASTQDTAHRLVEKSRERFFKHAPASAMNFRSEDQPDGGKRFTYEILGNAPVSRVIYQKIVDAFGKTIICENYIRYCEE